MRRDPTRHRLAPRWQRRPEPAPTKSSTPPLEVFGERGFARAKLDDVARRAGVSKGTLYLYFDSKEALFREMVRAKVVSVLVGRRGDRAQHRGLVARPARAAHAAHVGPMRRPGDGADRPAGARRAAQFPELARFYFEEVILRGRALGPAGARRGRRQRRIPAEPAQLRRARCRPCWCMGSKMQRFFARLRPRAARRRPRRSDGHHRSRPPRSARARRRDEVADHAPHVRSCSWLACLLAAAAARGAGQPPLLRRAR